MILKEIFVDNILTMQRLLPLLLLLIVSIFFILNYSDLKRELAYRLNISGDYTTSCCDVTNVLNQAGEFDHNANTAIYNSLPVDYPKSSLLAYQNLPTLQTQILGTTNESEEEKWIEVSLDEQKLRAWEGNELTMEFAISSGKWAPTPKGTYNIWYKTRYQAMTGGSKELGTYYYLPNVPHNMFFYQGYAIHGAYWHNNFGQPMSHGCVNSPLAYVAELFNWTGPVLPEGQNAIRATASNPGTRVWVH